MKRVLFLAAVLAALAGCATSLHKPVVDPKRTDMAQYETDLGECRQVAEQEAGTGTGAVAGAVGGYALGYLLGRTTGSRKASEVARGGAVLGGASGAAAGYKGQREIINNCMRGRGHAVLN